MMDGFTLYPAIDLRNGQVVRLRTGDPAQQSTYSSDPAQVAAGWADQGARWLHVVNLDAAFGEDDRANRQALLGILQAVNPAEVQVQFGGGLRSLETISAALQQGVARVVLGTAAALQPELVSQALERFGAERIATGLDARRGLVSVRGWVEGTSLEALTLAKDLAGMGVRTLIYTDISRDGAGQGGNLAETVNLAAASRLEVIASGGFTRQEEVTQVRLAGLAGVILGRALYEGRLDLRACLADCQAEA